MSDLSEILYKELKEFSLTNEKEYIRFHIKRFSAIIGYLAKEFPGRDCRILDIGSYGGHLLIGLRQKGYKNLCGADMPEINRIIRKRLEKYGFGHYDIDLRSLPSDIPGRSFDLIVFSETLEHLDFHPLYVFKEFSRLLKPGGKILITTPNLTRLNNCLKLLGGRSIHQDLALPYTSGTHYREYTAAEVAYLLERTGLSISRTKYIDFHYPDENALLAALNSVAGKIRKSWLPNYIITGEKIG